MTENQNGKKIEDRGENLLDIPNEYIKNERPKNESEKYFEYSSWKTEIKNKSIY